jgi:hypothetical protein
MEVKSALDEGMHVGLSNRINAILFQLYTSERRVNSTDKCDLLARKKRRRIPAALI